MILSSEKSKNVSKITILLDYRKRRLLFFVTAKVEKCSIFLFVIKNS